MPNRFHSNAESFSFKCRIVFIQMSNRFHSNVESFSFKYRIVFIQIPNRFHSNVVRRIGIENEIMRKITMREKRLIINHNLDGYYLSSHVLYLSFSHSLSLSLFLSSDGILFQGLEETGKKPTESEREKERNQRVEKSGKRYI